MSDRAAEDAAEDDGLHSLGIAALGQGYREGRFTPLDVTEALLARIQRLNPVLNAFLRVERDAALADAGAATSAFANGIDAGPLQGIPVGLKDLIDIEGLPTTCQSRVLLDNIAARDAAVVTTLREQGAVIMGKLATHEFANGLPSFDLPFPPARNPWNHDHHPGGSSSGSGSAVAGRLLPLALGTDTGGSVRHPASASGLTGIKPTYGAISRRGVMPLSQTMDNIGLLTRDVTDGALALSALTRHDPADPGSQAAPWTDAGTLLDGGARGLRIGYVKHFHTTDMVADPEVAQSLDQAADMLGKAGADVREVSLAPVTEYFAVNRVILHAEAFGVHGQWLREKPEAYGQTLRDALLVGAFLTAEDMVRGQLRRHELVRQMAEVFDDIDVLLCASSMEPAWRFDDPEGIARTYVRQARAPFNVTGFPAMTVMTGQHSNGLPLSAQFATAPWKEPMMLRAARAYETLRGPVTFPEL